MEARELRDLTPDELVKKLEAATRELFSLGLRLPGQHPNTARLAALRRDVARLKTTRAHQGVRL